MLYLFLVFSLSAPFSFKLRLCVKSEANCKRWPGDLARHVFRSHWLSITPPHPNPCSPSTLGALGSSKSEFWEGLKSLRLGCLYVGGQPDFLMNSSA